MTFDLQRTLRALIWGQNARSHPAMPEVRQEILEEARRLHNTGDHDRAVICLQTDSNWQHDARAVRVIGLSSQALARYESDPDRRDELIRISEQAADRDRALRAREVAKADVNLASTLIDQLRYSDALNVAFRALSIDPALPTIHVAILAIYNRQEQRDALCKHLIQLMEKETWIFEDDVFREHVATDPDLVGISDLISQIRRN